MLKYLFLTSIFGFTLHCFPVCAQDSYTPDRTIQNDCNYERIQGLAEVVSIEISRLANESPLNYDEYEVLFIFHPMGQGQLLEELVGKKMEFHLKSKAVKVPVGPEYIKQKQVKVGLKYAMDLFQSNSNTCLEKYTYSSKALNNDLFEAFDHVLDYTKEHYIKNQESEELAYERRKGIIDYNSVDETEKKIEALNSEWLDFEIDYGSLSEEEIAGMSEEEMKELVEKNVRNQINSSNVSLSQLGIDVQKMRTEIEAEIRKKHEAEFSEIEKLTVLETEEPVQDPTQLSNAQQIKNAKLKAKEEERLAKLEKKRKEQIELDRRQKEKEIRERLEKEIEAEIQRELKEKEEIALKKRAQLLKEEEEEKIRQQQAVEKMKSIEMEIKKRIIDETMRNDCVFSERIPGKIEIISIQLSTNSSNMEFQYDEYDVIIRFTPQNIDELGSYSKEKWRSTSIFTLDPKGVNQKPGMGYLSKYRLKEGKVIEGFAQELKSGICSKVMVYAPELPNDAGKINLK